MNPVSIDTVAEIDAGYREAHRLLELHQIQI
jgi:hypothetical protein